MAGSAHAAGDLLPLRTVSSTDAGAELGYSISAIGTNRFAVGLPYLDSAARYGTNLIDVGYVLIYDLNTNLIAGMDNPDHRPGDMFGSVLADVGTNLLAVGVPYKDVYVPPPFSVLLKDSGAVYLYNENGSFRTNLFNPRGAINDPDHFGTALARLGNDRLLVGSPDDDLNGTNSTGAVFIYGLNGELLRTVLNPFPSPDARFGSAVAGLGTNRFVVGAPGEVIPTGGYGRLYLFDDSGNLIRPIPYPLPPGHNFGLRLQEVGTNGWFIASAPWAPVTTTLNGVSTNFTSAGLVFLFDQDGNYQMTISNPTPAHFDYFGWSLARVGKGRFAVATPGDVLSNVAAGSAYLFNLDGLRLGTMENPTPVAYESFGLGLAGVGEEYIVAGTPHDSTKAGDGGSAYLFRAPILEFYLGKEIPPPPSVDLQTIAVTGPPVVPPDATFWHSPTRKLYAVKSGPLLISWRKADTTTNYVQGINVWPTNSADYQLHIAGSLPVPLTGFSQSQLLQTESGTGVDDNDVQTKHQFAASAAGRSLLLLSSGSPQLNPVYFQLIKSIAWNDPAYLHTNAPTEIGAEITNSFGYHDPACGGPLVMQSNSVYCASAGFYDRATRSGSIIAVNTDKPHVAYDDLVIAYYQKGARLKDGTGASVPTQIDWPWKPVQYVPQWPTNPPVIVIASQQGTGVIDPDIYKNWNLYSQNISNAPGFNPNDEHALRRPYDSKEALFALRDDLGSTNTSLPYVLMTYFDASNRGRMKVWRVAAEQAPYFFTYEGKAGSLIQPPFPLNVLDICPENAGAGGPYWRDRKGDFWAKAAGLDGGTTNIVMRYFYPLQDGFFLPPSFPPLAVGAHVPWLDSHAGTPGVPQNINYTISWPDAPKLLVGETLVKPKNALPAISEQTSVDVLYQQSVQQGHGPSVKLIDPTDKRVANLSQLPPDMATVNEGNMIYFPTLPPQLRSRFYYDPAQKKLIFKGELAQPDSIDYYLLLNVITLREKSILRGLSSDGAYTSAVDALAAAAVSPKEAMPNLPFDSLALTAGDAKALGYVTLAFGNSTNLSPPGEPVSLSIIQVACPRSQGQLKVIASANPFDEKLTLRHSGDFAGRTDDYLFEWRTLPPDNGQPSGLPFEAWAAFNPSPANGQGAVDITLQGAGLQTLSDNFFVCRYRSTDANAPCGTNWSQWTQPALAEGWIKRVLTGINPFEQKIKDYQNNTVNTIVSMLSQAGARWVGNVPLNQQAADHFGLIEIYETILKRGIGLSIEGTPSVNYPPANDALLLAAGRIADLYLLLGNEAYADAADPTIAIGTDDGTYGTEATSLHCFMNQTSSLLEEELALLRGRDDSLLPSVQTYPVYNRLTWNFTHDLNGGEVAYALNYNIQDQNGDAEGVIDEADAKLLYPQGHGDAWGHYLTAIKNYYHLLRSTNFTWVPRIESVLVAQSPVSVDYLDERKFAHAAAARAKTGAEIVNLTYRQFFVEDPKGQYQGYHDSNTNRAWGLAEWGCRAAQGALFDWMTANAMLPAVSTNTGLQKVDRTSVKELQDIASSLADIQVQVDNADKGLNPIGLAKNVLPFDIDPTAISQGKTHFEQVYDRAVKALNSAIQVFNHANNATQLLRRQADSAQKFHDTVADSEADFNNRLIEIFGYPYSDDIGPNGAYPSGYVGPDIYHFDYVDASALLGATPPPSQTLSVLMKESSVNTTGALSSVTKTVSFNIAPHGLGLIKPQNWLGSRQAPGELQMSRSDLLQARGRFEKLLTDYNALLDNIDDQSRVLVVQYNANLAEIGILEGSMTTQKELISQINEARAKQKFFTTAANTAKRIGDAVAEQFPKSAGLAIDATSVARGAAMVMGTIASELLSKQADANAELEQEHAQAREIQQYLTNIELTSARNDAAFQHQLAQLEQLIRQESSLRLEIFTLNEAMQQASGRYLATLSKGVRLLDDRLRFRRQTAAQIQNYRYKDMAFRIFRNDAIQKYRAQFDLAARYVYLAARAYDYETCLSQGDPRGPGEQFLTDIVRSRSLGLIQNELPLTGPAQGDGGLADPMARLSLNWNLVLKGQLGFNNPQTETGRFSLRSEKFRIQPGFAGNVVWRQTLTSLVVSNLLDLPEFQRYCIPFQPMLAVEPGLVIPFSTTVNFGQNFFGWPAGGGDNDYDSTHFATKIRSVGVWFANYNGLGGGMINTPRVYLVPVGNDILRSPTAALGQIREWTILDQLMPVPFPLSGDALSDPNWLPMNNTFGTFGETRKFPRFRAYHDSGTFEASETINDSRLVGRSVWNSRWLLIIPAGSLHSDRNEGLERFINGALVNGTRDGNGVSDIKVFFQT
jgi:hypothetical protein